MEKGASRTSEILSTSEEISSNSTSHINIPHSSAPRPKHKISSIYMLPPKAQRQPRIGPEFQASIPSIQPIPKSRKRKNEDSSVIEFKKPKIDDSLI